MDLTIYSPAASFSYIIWNGHNLKVGCASLLQILLFYKNISELERFVSAP